MAKNRLKDAMERGLASVHMDDIQKQRIIIQAINEEKQTESRKTPKLRAALVVALAILTMSVTVFAAQQAGWLDWKGNFYEGETLLPTPSPVPEMRREEEIEKLAESLLQNVPADEKWEAEYEINGIQSKGIRMNLKSDEAATLEELRERSKHLALLTPARAPEGFRVESIRLHYNQWEIPWEDEPYAEQITDGVTLRKYRLKNLPREGMYGYEVFMRDDHGRTFVVNAKSCRKEDMEPEDLEGYFPVSEGKTYEKLNIEGFDAALRFAGEQYETNLRREAGESVEFYYVWSPEPVDIRALFSSD